MNVSFGFSPLALKDFRRRPVFGLYCQQNRQLQRIEKRLREEGIPVYEADIRPPERYLMERFITAPVWFDGEQRGDSVVNAAAQTPSRLSPAAEMGLAGH
ncbi:DNA polymerase II [Pantoea agglomerans]|uniref:DNA polymerase II n=1 Tax=Enterobacter agglomerans TaxID=549 RepID=A0A379AKY3_ENTAG|nr:DNA polymerase II [Pantoea agglomerans]